jgi:hypothetical protein
MEEIWKDVKGFEGRFRISNHGKVMSINGRFKGERLLTPCADTNGYFITQLRMKPFNKFFRIHQLVAEHFIFKPEGLHYICVNHKDGNKQNNHVSNLEWLSRKDNCTHAVDTGLHSAKGSKHHNSKLTENKVIEMRGMYKTGKYTHEQIGSLFGITRRQAGDVINKVNWKHI